MLKYSIVFLVLFNILQILGGPVNSKPSKKKKSKKQYGISLSVPYSLDTEPSKFKNIFSGLAGSGLAPTRPSNLAECQKTGYCNYGDCKIKLLKPTLVLFISNDLSTIEGEVECSCRGNYVDGIGTDLTAMKDFVDGIGTGMGTDFTAMKNFVDGIETGMGTDFTAMKDFVGGIGKGIGTDLTAMKDYVDGIGTDLTARKCSHKGKSKLTAFLISLFVGGVGGDWFYLSGGNTWYIVMGFFKLATFLFSCYVSCVIGEWFFFKGDESCCCTRIVARIVKYLTYGVVGIWWLVDFCRILFGQWSHDGTGHQVVVDVSTPLDDFWGPQWF